MATLTAKQQVREEQRQRIAAKILEGFFAYSSYSSGYIIGRCHEPLPKNITEDTKRGLELQQSRAQKSLAVAHQIQLLMDGVIE